MFHIGSRNAFTSNISTTLIRPLRASFLPWKSTFTSGSARSYSTWSSYNRHYGRNKINWAQLRKPALFTAAFCAGTTLAAPYLFAAPPFSYFRRHPTALVYTIIGANVVGFLAWKTPQGSRFMSRYGLLVRNNTRSLYSLVGSAFSHQEGMHLLFNMLMLYSFGSTLCAYVGAANFFTMYMNSAVVSSFVSMAVPVVMRATLVTASLGASGAIFSVFGAFSFLFPRSPIALFFLPIPGGAWVAFLGSLAFNVAGIAMKWGRYDYAAHVGGCIAGVAYGWWYDRKRTQARRRVW